MLDLRCVYEPQQAVEAGLDHCVGGYPCLGAGRHPEARAQPAALSVEESSEPLMSPVDMG